MRWQLVTFVIFPFEILKGPSLRNDHSCLHYRDTEAESPWTSLKNWKKKAISHPTASSRPLNKHSFLCAWCYHLYLWPPYHHPNTGNNNSDPSQACRQLINFSSVNTNNIKTSSNLGWLYEPLGRAEQADDEKKGPPKRDWHKGRSYTQFWGSHL